MKKHLMIIILTWLTVISSGQNFEIRSIENAFGYMEIQIRDTSFSGNVNAGDTITDLQFEIRWPDSVGADLDIEIMCSEYNLVDGLNSKQSKNQWYWRAFAADSMPLAGNTWPQNTWQTIATFKVTSSNENGTGSFSMPDEAWVVQGLNMGINGNDYPAFVADSIIDLNFPTIIYDHVWKGGSTGGGYSGTSWTYGPNWVNECGEEHLPGQEPGSASACFIPGGLSEYPTDFYNSVSDSCNILRIMHGADVSVPGGINLVIVVELSVEYGAELEVKPGGNVVVK